MATRYARTRSAFGMALLAAVALATAACGATNGPGADPKASVDPSLDGLGAGASPSASGPAGSSANGGSANGGSAGGGGHGNPRPSGSGHTGTAGGTSIVYFRIKQHPKCPTGKSPAVSLIIAWKVTGASNVALSVDHTNMVGSYGTYDGTEGQEEFTFSCGGAAGSTETHRYVIHTLGGTVQKRAELTVSAKVEGPTVIN